MLTLRFLGGFEVHIDGVTAKCSPAPARLLCRLVIDANRAIPRNRLWQDLWPDSDTPDVVDINIRRVRKDILSSEGSRLHVEGNTVLLDLAGADIDFLRFQEAINDGSIPALEEAVRLYRGELLLRYLNEGWALNLRDELKTDFEDALKTLAESALQEGEFLIAARHLRRFIESNPDYEWGWFRLIEAYREWGNVTEALATYSAYVERIRASRHPLSARIEGAIARLREEQQTRQVTEITTVPSPIRTVALDDRLIVGGALPPDSPFYVARDEDVEAYRALATPGTTVRIKGPRQVGKSSLLARSLRRCREAGMLVLLTDWQNLPHPALGSAEAFYKTLAYKLSDQAGLDVDPVSVFRPHLAPGDNFDRFFVRLLIPSVGRPIIWAIDEADRIFSCDFFGEVFAKLRAWHNERALDAQGPFSRLSLVLSYSTEARLFIPNLNQSPFNVGVELALRDFTLEQSADLNESYGRPLGGKEEIERLYRLVAGHPYLTSRALYEARVHGRMIEQLDTSADKSEGIFADHLERLRFVLGMNPELADAMRRFLLEDQPPTLEQFVRLNSAGVLTNTTSGRIQPRCLLYERYLREALV